MSKKLDEPTVARHIELYKEDWDFLNTNFGKHSPLSVGPGRIIRDLVRKKVRALRAAQIGSLDEIVPGDGVIASRTMERLAEVKRDRESEALGNIVDPSVEDLF